MEKNGNLSPSWPFMGKDYLSVGTDKVHCSAASMVSIRQGLNSLFPSREERVWVNAVELSITGFF
jgi:hypothetical protein